MPNIVELALRRPYTFVVMAILIAIYGTLAAIRTPVRRYGADFQRAGSKRGRAPHRPRSRACHAQIDGLARLLAIHAEHGVVCAIFVKENLRFALQHLRFRQKKSFGAVPALL
jgi:hypothetical protein